MRPKRLLAASCHRQDENNLGEEDAPDHPVRRVGERLPTARLHIGVDDHHRNQEECRGQHGPFEAMPYPAAIELLAHADLLSSVPLVGQTTRGPAQTRSVARAKTTTHPL